MAPALDECPDSRPPLRTPSPRQKSRLLHRRHPVSRHRHRRKHFHLQHHQRAPAPPASLQRRHPTRHPLESLPRPRHHARLVFHRAIFRHQERPLRLRRCRHRLRHQRQSHRQRRPRTHRHNSHLLESSSAARLSRRVGTPVSPRRRSRRPQSHRDSELRHLDAPLRLRPAHPRQKNRHQRHAARSGRHSPEIFFTAARSDAHALRR